MQLYRRYIQIETVDICIKTVNIQENNERIFSAAKAGVSAPDAGFDKCEQFVDRFSPV